MLLAKDEKPVVASMSDLGASGGYYIAMAADSIVAQPATLTGSIGVVSGKFHLAPALFAAAETDTAAQRVPRYAWPSVIELGSVEPIDAAAIRLIARAADCLSCVVLPRT